MFRIAKAFTFSAAHQLLSLPPDHPCARVHGHNYRAEIVLESDTLDRNGMVLDYGVLKAAVAPLIDRLDHQHLNDALSYLPGDRMKNADPTAEVLAYRIHTWVARWLEQLPEHTRVRLVSVEVRETEGTWARYQPDATDR